MSLGSAACVLLALVASCYSPALRDCTVSCEAIEDCAGDQLCGEDGFCAAPGVANHCAQTHVPDDGGPDGRPGADAAKELVRDAAVHDATSPRDAAIAADAGPTVILHLHDDGKGEIATGSTVLCDSQGPAHGDCMVPVPAGVAITLDATGESNQVFRQWMGQACAGSNASCTFVPLMPMTDIHAQFAKVD